jgi:3-hydroxymyristoyl/3-hydroxydecanoyl-(acyl carrier protein) dehydratase
MWPILTQGRSGHGFPLRLVDRVAARAADAATVICGPAADGFMQTDRTDPAVPWPGTLVIEAMAQAARAIVGVGDPGHGDPGGGVPGLLAAIDDLRLHAPVRVGDRLAITARIVAAHGRLVRVACQARVVDGAGTPVAEGELTLSMGTA